MKIKYLFFLVTISAFTIQCNSSKTKELKPSGTPSETDLTPTWLVGEWERVGEKENQKTYESWVQIDEKEFKGLGCTLKNNDTIWREDIVLIEEKTEWQFKVLQLGDSIPTIFTVTRFSPSGFVCENEANDFPKKIEYTYDGTNLQAQISGGGPVIPFNFIPIAK